MNNCLTDDEVTYKAQGHELWKAGEEHLLECSSCREKVEESSKAFILQEASQPPNRPDKMGRSHPGYIRAIA